MQKELLVKIKQEYEDFLSFYKQDIGAIRTGRATPSLVEDLHIDYFNEKYRLKELASITSPEPKLLVIQPWDKGALDAIAGAIQKSSLGINPVNDGQAIRLNFPHLTEERRKEFIKLLKQKTEETRIKIRRARDEVRDRINKLEKKGEMGEDDKFRSQEDLQKIVDEYNQKIEEFERKKESELITA